MYELMFHVYVFCLGCLGLGLDMDVWIFGLFGYFVENNGMIMLGCFIV